MRVIAAILSCVIFVAQAEALDRLEAASALIDACREAQPDRAALLSAHEITGNYVEVSRAWRVEPGAACYDGFIVAETAAWFQALETPLETLVIRSGGGNGPAGVVAGEHLAEWGAELIVHDHCFSSCANFVFLGAPKRTVPAPGVVGYHLGGLAWTRYEALQTRTARADPDVRRIADYAITRLNRTGRNDVPDAVWRTLPESIRSQLQTDIIWRRRIERLHVLAGVRSGFSVAHNLIRAKMPDHARSALPALFDGAALFWTPDEETLRLWGFNDVVMWDADPELVLAFGLETTPPTVNVSMRIEPGDFPLAPYPSWGDDSAEWPAHGGDG